MENLLNDLILRFFVCIFFNSITICDLQFPFVCNMFQVTLLCYISIAIFPGESYHKLDITRLPLFFLFHFVFWSNDIRLYKIYQIYIYIYI